jgi:hypothetical protein
VCCAGIVAAVVVAGVAMLANPRSPHRALTVRRQRRGDRLAHRAAVHVIPPCQRPDRHPAPAAVSAYGVSPSTKPIRCHRPSRNRGQGGGPASYAGSTATGQRQEPRPVPPPGRRSGKIAIRAWSSRGWVQVGSSDPGKLCMSVKTGRQGPVANRLRVGLWRTASSSRLVRKLS